MKRLLLSLSFSLCAGLAFAQPGGSATAPRPTAPSPFSGRKLTYKIIPACAGTWCYDIYADGRMLVHQPSVPGLPGNAGFKTKEAAGKVAALVIARIRKGEMPPTVEIQDLRRLGAI